MGESVNLLGLGLRLKDEDCSSGGIFIVANEAKILECDLPGCSQLTSLSFVHGAWEKT
jgi:hypothetical protein